MRFLDVPRETYITEYKELGSTITENEMMEP